MTNPYVPPSLTGYNANPPSDDGTKDTQNQLRWSNHIDKIGDPLKLFLEIMDANVLTAFGLVFGSAVRVLTADYTVIQDDRGRFLSVSGVTTITLITALLAGSGFPIAIANTGEDAVTVNSSDLINGDASVNLQPGEGVIVSCDGTTWVGFETLAKITGTFVSNWTGFAAPQSTTFSYTRVGNIVTILPAVGFSDTSNSTVFTSDSAAAPAIIRPTQTVRALYAIVDNAVNEVGLITVLPSGFLSFDKIDGSLFQASGTKGFTGGQVFTYTLD